VRVIGLIVVSLLAALVVATGCETSTTSGGTTRYNNDQYSFSFEIADRFEKAEGQSAQSSGNADLNVAFFDPDGSKSGDSLRDGMLVSVYELKTAITPDLMDEFKTELQGVLDSLAANDPSVKLGPLNEASLDGASGYMTDYTMTLEGLPVQARTYFVVKDDIEYQITIQASQDNWADDEPDLQKAVDSFKVE
jgi:hypothetical protein